MEEEETWDWKEQGQGRGVGERGKMRRKKKKMPKTGIIRITRRLKPFVFDLCQSTFPY